MFVPNPGDIATHAPDVAVGLPLARVNPVVDESLRQKIVDVLERDRTATDETLRTERELADTRIVDPMGRSAEADERSDLQYEPENVGVVPVATETLVEAADDLTEAAIGLTRAAHKLKQAGDPSVVETLHQVATRLDATADRVTGEPTSLLQEPPPETAEAAPIVAGKLAQVAENLGAVAASLAEERMEVDEAVRQERQRLDHSLGEREVAGKVLADALDEQQQLLDEERQQTDRNLQRERSDTDRALDQTLELLQDEQHAHGAMRDMMVTREEFLAIISHDLRTPLNVVGVNAAIIAERAAAEGCSADIVRSVQRIQRSADQMGRMLSDLLDATRFEHGQFRLTPRNEDVAGLVEECAATFEDVAREHGVSLEIDTPGRRVAIRFDRDRILQVLSNLLRNALQFTPAGGVITIRVVPQNGGCRIEVSDTGGGIDAGDLDRIFDRFHQATGTHHHGLGLGLYISRAIVQAHGGTIWATSEKGKGSTFSFTLPQ